MLMAKNSKKKENLNLVLHQFKQGLIHSNYLYFLYFTFAFYPSPSPSPPTPPSCLPLLLPSPLPLTKNPIIKATWRQLSPYPKGEGWGEEGGVLPHILGRVSNTPTPYPKGEGRQLGGGVRGGERLHKWKFTYT